MSPTQRTLAELRKEGYSAWIVEKWNPFAHIRQDLFGIIDIVAIKAGTVGVLGVQCTSMGNGPARVKKARESDYLGIWLDSANLFQVWEWGKQGKREERKLWMLKITHISAN